MEKWKKFVLGTALWLGAASHQAAAMEKEAERIAVPPLPQPSALAITPPAPHSESGFSHFLGGLFHSKKGDGSSLLSSVEHGMERYFKGGKDSSGVFRPGLTDFIEGWQDEKGIFHPSLFEKFINLEKRLASLEGDLANSFKQKAEALEQRSSALEAAASRHLTDMTGLKEDFAIFKAGVGGAFVGIGVFYVSYKLLYQGLKDAVDNNTTVTGFRKQLRLIMIPFASGLFGITLGLLSGGLTYHFLK